MPQTIVTPQAVADFLILAYAAIELLRRLRAKAPRPASHRGTTVVLWGCYVIALLALNTTIPSPVTAAQQTMWIGSVAAACGLGLRIWMALPAIGSGRTPPRPGIGTRPLDHLGRLALWIGATAASGNLIAVLTVTVAMVAALGVRSSEERRTGADPRLEGR